MATDRRDDQDTVNIGMVQWTIFNSLDKSEAKTRSEYSDWIETVSKDAIIIQDITLTARYRLKKNAVEATSQTVHQ